MLILLHILELLPFRARVIKKLVTLLGLCRPLKTKFINRSIMSIVKHLKTKAGDRYVFDMAPLVSFFHPEGSL